MHIVSKIPIDGGGVHHRISDYNKDSGKYGEYFTPHSIESIIARILVPAGDHDVAVYDPAAGTGTLVLAIAHQMGEGMLVDMPMGSR